MTDLSTTITDVWTARRRIDWAWAATPLILIAVAVLAPQAVGEITLKTAQSFIGTLPFIAFAICATAYLRASSAEGVVAKAFTGDPVRMIVVASLVGGMAPFCSCEVIPFIAAMLAMGAPLSAVMAFWLASPLMDPAMFAITAGALGVDFAVGKAIAAIGLGLFGGFGVMALSRTAIFANPLRPGSLATASSSCCGSEPVKVAPSCCGSESDLSHDRSASDSHSEGETYFDQKPVWAFWREKPRRETFTATAMENGLFLGKWLLLAYVLEAVMVRWLPADLIASVLGGDGVGTILLAAVVGAPAYLNGYAAAPLAAGLMEQGMSAGAAMSFLLAGGVTCIPAAVAVFSLVKTKVFVAYVGFAVVGSVLAGLTFAAAT